MSHVDTKDQATLDYKPNVSRIAVAFLTLGIGACFMVVRLWWIEPLKPNIHPKGWGAIPFALILGLGLSVVLLFGWANRRRWRIVLRPTRGRIIGTMILGALTPFAVYSWVPWIVGGWVVFFVLISLSEHWWTWSTSFFGVGIFFGLVVINLVWYPISCLIVSGVRSRWMRVALYALMFWTCYSAIILVAGTMIFRL